MKLIIGLGNPGLQYQKTWHNLGFLATDKIAQNGFDQFKYSKKFQAEIADGKINNEKIILAQPQTFMNLSGQAVEKLMKFYKISPADLIVIHDDIDLPLGKIRIAKNSSSGGHNGIKSIIEQIGSQDFTRIKIGIKTPLSEKIGAEAYVLKKFSKAEEKIVNEVIKKVTTSVTELVTNGLDSAMSPVRKTISI